MDGDRPVAIRKEKIFAFLWNGCDLSAFPTRGEVGVQQIMINKGARKLLIVAEHFFRMMVGNLSCSAS